MKLTYFGHACFSVASGGTTLLFDPFITPNGLAKDINIETIEADVILLSHGHGDHIADAAAIAKRTGAPIVAAYEVAEWMSKQGVAQVVHLNHGGSWKFTGGRVKMVAAVHSSVLPDGTYGGNPAGFVVENAEGAFYYAGDTALTLDMKLIADEFRISFAVLPIGDTFTMGHRDAARAAEFVGTKRVVGVHYDTFPPIQLDRQAAFATFRDAQIPLFLPAIGESITL